MSLLTWLADPPADRGMRVLAAGGTRWDFHSYRSLASLTRRAARRLRSAGVTRGDAVVVVRPASAEFMADFFGAIMLGATPSPVAPPAAFRDRTAYLDHMARIVRRLRARVVATTADAAAVIEPVATAGGAAVVTDIPEDVAPWDGSPAPPEIGLIQFSSGSTGTPKGVRIPFTALQANVSALYEWLRITDADSYASWLPLHHDMGLIGLFMLPIEGRSDMWLMQPEDFVRAPLRWLRCFGEGGATMTATPTFGLAQVVRRLRPEHLAGLDLSRWRGAIVGAERIDMAVVRRFLDLLAPCGLRRDVIVPAYGLAESTLAVTGAPCGRELKTVTVDGASLALGQPVAAVTGEDSGMTLVGCGSPISGVQACVIDENGCAVPDGVLGEIEVRGTSLAAGYLSEGREDEAFHGVLRTGDAGFRHANDLFVVGRLGDGVKQFGRWFFAEDAQQIAAAFSPRPRQTVALVGALSGQNTAAVLVEGSLGGAAARIGRAVARHVTGMRVVVISVPAGKVAWTTSGKPKRRVMWRWLADGHPGGTIRWDSDQSGDGAAGLDPVVE